MEVYQVIFILLALMASAFFSGIEMAFLSANRLHIEVESKKGALSGIILSYFVKHPSQFIGTTLAGNTIALVLYGILMVNGLNPWLLDWLHLLPPPYQQPVALVIEVTLSTLILLVLAEYLPKTLFLLDPDRILAIFAMPMVIIYVLMYLPVAIIVNLTKFVITKLFGLHYAEDKPAFRITDLNHYLNSLNKKERAVEESEVDTQIFNNALEFKTVRVRECLVPRTELTAVELDAPIEEVRKTFVESGHSKVLVYQETIDNVIGYCHALALFKKPKNVASILTPIIIVPETMMANELLIRFTSERKSLALVVDEFGGTSGLVTLEDVMEKIFGEIQDEYDVSEDWTEQKLDDHNYILSARQEIDYLNEKYGWNFPEGDYDTLGGLIIAVNEDLPQISEVISLPPFTFTILSMEDARIGMVKLTLAEDFDNNAT